MLFSWNYQIIIIYLQCNIKKMGKRKLAIDDFKKLYRRYHHKIDEKYSSLNVDFCAKIYIDLKEHNKNFKKMLNACEKREMREYEVLEIVLFHCYYLSSTNSIPV